MKNLIFLIFILSFLLAPFIVCGQSLDTLRGIIKDSIGHPIPGANVWVYTQDDSIHNISNDYGQVKFPIIFSGGISIKITSLGYQELRLNMEAGKNFFKAVLKDKLNFLKEVVIKGLPQAVIVKKDTVEYDISQFIRTPDDVIQDLLERLPGLQVNPDGSISMMGNKVVKIRINGQEFLIEDIKTLTSIIPANLINKIQLIDDYGEESRLTGRRAGESQKIINLTTKSNTTNIYVGRLMAAKGIKNLYSLYGNLFKYNNQQSIMILLSNNNIGNYSGNANNTEGEMSFRHQIGKGFSINLGINLKNNSYDYGSNSESQTTTNEGLLITNSNSNGNNKNNNFSPKMEVILELNERNHFKFNLSGNFDRTDNLNSITDLQTGFQRKDVSVGNTNNNQSNQVNGNLFFSHKFKKPGRGMYVDLNAEGANISDDLDIANALRFYLNNNSSYYDSTLHQLIIGKYHNNKYQARISFVEPIKEKNSLEIRYSFFESNSGNKRNTSWMDEAGKFTLVDSLSNRYFFKIIQNQLELNFLQKNKNLELTFGGSIKPYSLIESNKRTGILFFPVFRLFYNLKNSSSLNINFLGDNIFPTFQQLANFPDYSNLQNPVYGNPNLKVASKYGISIGYIKTNPKSRLFLKLQGNLLQKNIVSNIFLIEDAFGSLKQETHFVNVNGTYSIDGKIGFSSQFKKNNRSWAMEMGSGYAHNILLYNNSPKFSNNLSANSQISLDYRNGILNIFPSLAYNLSKSSYSIYDNNSITTQNIKIGFRSILIFSQTFSIESTLTKLFNWGFGSGLSRNPLMIDTNFHKRWLKKRLWTSLECYNLLNERSSISQGISGNVISVTSSNNIGRYFLIKVIFDLKAL
ncbi:TonB-dependent receptor [Chitinophaga sancti]|uniref:Outer membrane receptor proteins, mostly Fe transport n=1 Tax=Chitinophaga sancti TaxID=1004 RepID=A0A1K1T3D0_9BACT|nr:TonB-dependent receptor [Chitinophaga sancti]WQD59600.1 TonB-dependent receptor [Chitinophaga sancti]WQG88267.1 TonB-dependent receptor [Chitinophaga sancti]SFW91022.1 Outer membrane receptor proteins, mostly Fe transport [Chitinophaga sancti]